MAHYLRYLQYGNKKDKMAAIVMISNSTAERRREIAKLAGSIGGKKQQQLLKIQNRGFFNSKIQSELGKKGTNSARQKGVGAFDMKNKEKADKAWQEKYQTDKTFQEKMKKNLNQGLKTQRLQKENIHNPISQRIRSVIYHGVLIGNKRVCAPYSFYKFKSGEFEYTEARTHLSEDFFWYYIMKS